MEEGDSDATKTHRIAVGFSGRVASPCNILSITTITSIPPTNIISMLTTTTIITTATTAIMNSNSSAAASGKRPSRMASVTSRMPKA